MWHWFRPLLSIGSSAPDFTLPDQDGHAVTLSSFRGRSVVLVFYPGDDTRICTSQLCEWRDQEGELSRRGVQVLGINPQSEAKHQAFRNRYRFSFPLLVDAGRQVARSFAADGLVVRRTVYGIDAEGCIRLAERGKPAVERVLEAL